ncbi:freyrasin family ranthipeptide [Clostridium algidicarnis]|uniref:freyrasin family ranthipeptide n=1 Tax=Clostridium algidicarnis TaxID=37659 RepID=UPI0016243E00|nr:freyrasin family ranthipeptide [Clostridium algidicarnis]MBB6631883.1 freyrasin family ranthipeptide [Clostridium algidicarnis]MBB6698712.1 freyrasin family ranthipeptide [Clostridium algidicarnis]
MLKAINKSAKKVGQGNVHSYGCSANDFCWNCDTSDYCAACDMLDNCIWSDT